MKQRPSDRGATSVEYSLLAVFVAAVIAATVTVLGGQVMTLYNVVF